MSAMPHARATELHPCGGAAAPNPAPAPCSPFCCPQDKPWAFWERRTHAVVWRLLAHGLLTLDELRRAVQLPGAEAARTYYEK